MKKNIGTGFRKRANRGKLKRRLIKAALIEFSPRNNPYCAFLNK